MVIVVAWVMARGCKDDIVALRLSASMAAEAFYLQAADEEAAARRAKRLCRMPKATVLDVTVIRAAQNYQVRESERLHEGTQSELS